MALTLWISPPFSLPSRREIFQPECLIKQAMLIGLDIAAWLMSCAPNSPYLQALSPIPKMSSKNCAQGSKSHAARTLKGRGEFLINHATTGGNLLLLALRGRLRYCAMRQRRQEGLRGQRNGVESRELTSASQARPHLRRPQLRGSQKRQLQACRDPLEQLKELRMKKSIGAQKEI